MPAGITHARYTAAADQLQARYGRRPTRLEVLSLLAELAVQDEELATAAACFQQIPSTHPAFGRSARLQEGQILLRLNRARDAERSLREFLRLAAANPSTATEHVIVARNWLLYLLSVELRLEERKTLLAEIHAQGLADVFDSKQLYFPHLLLWHSSSGRHRLAQWLTEDPSDPQLRLAEGRYLIMEGRLAEARRWLSDLVEEHPGDRACAAALLECCFEQNDWDAFVERAQSLPAPAPDDPWLLTHMRAQWALREKRWDDAVAHFQQLLEADPANPWCPMGLAQAYAGLQQPHLQEAARQRALKLARIRQQLVTVKEDAPNASRKLSAECDELGLTDAAETFRRHAVRIERTLEATRGAAPPQPPGPERT